MQSNSESTLEQDRIWMEAALRLAKRGSGCTSPNPMVGAVLAKSGRIIGRGWHHRAGEPHAEVEAIRDAQKHGQNICGSTLYVTLEPCSTHGRTPPCTDAIVQGRISRVVAAMPDPNPKHAGRGLEWLRRAGITVESGLCSDSAARLNEAFNHWVVRGTPFVTVKAAMTLDGKIATISGESKWITSPRSRALGMRLRYRSDAILVGINTILADDPRLTVRRGERVTRQRLRRIVLDASARIPIHAQVLADDRPELTTIVVSESAPPEKNKWLADRANLLVAPLAEGKIDLRWVLKQLGANSVSSLLVEGGAEVNASFLLHGLAQRIAFFYAPRIVGGRNAASAVGGTGISKLAEAVRLSEVRWRQLGEDFLLTGRLIAPQVEGS